VAGLDEVDRPPGRRRDHRDAGGERLLDRLPEGLELARGDEHVEGRHRPRQLLAPELAEEDRVGELGLEFGPAGAVPDDDRLRAGQVGQHAQVGDLLLVREASEVADDLAPRRQPGAQCVVAPGRGEEASVDAASPVMKPSDAVLAELIHAGGRRHERQRRRLVDQLDALPQQRFERGQPVAGGVGGDVGLVDRDRRQPEVARGEQPAAADVDGGGEVDDVGGEARERPGEEHARRRRDAHLRVPRHRDRRHRHHGRAAVVRRHALGLGGQDQQVVALLDQVVGAADHRVGDPVDVGKERFCQDDDSHVISGNHRRERRPTFV